MPAPPASDSSSLLVSAGLFIVVVLASQVIQNRRENDKEKKHLVDLDLGHRYSMKRHYLTEKQEASLESVRTYQECFHVLQYSIVETDSLLLENAWI